MTSEPTHSLSELPLSVVLLVFSGGAFWQAYQISGFDSVSGPGAIPMLAAGVMVIASAILLARSFTVAGKVHSLSDRLTLFAENALPLKVVVMVAMMGLYLYAMTRLGFMLSSGLFLFFSLSYLWQRGAVRAFLITVVSLVVIWLIFRTVFHVVLPQGSWLTGVF